MPAFGQKRSKTKKRFSLTAPILADSGEECKGKSENEKTFYWNKKEKMLNMHNIRQMNM
jgi:tyrosyl-tRNA synthetase